MSELFQTIEPWANVWGAGLWRASWQGGLVIVAAWAIAGWCTFLSPRIVCWIWRLACVKLLVALLWVQPVTIPVLPANEMPTAMVERPVPAPVTTRTEAAAPRPLAELRPAPANERSPTGHATIWSWLLTLWLIGVVVRVALTARQWKAVRRICGSSEPSQSMELQQVCRRKAERLGIRRLPRIRFSSHTDVPLLAGIWRPMILLPTGALELFDHCELRLMLGHELAHLKRRDLLWNWLPTIAGWLFFFHPLVWLVPRRWSEAQEAACDELLIQNDSTSPAAYGRLLVKLAARWPREQRAELMAAGVLGTYRDLERRILAMIRVKTLSRKRLIFAASTAFLVAALGIIPWTLVAQETNRSTSDAGRAQGQSFLSAGGGDGEPIQQTATPLPGKIYSRVSLEFKNEAGAAEKYSGIIAIDPNTGDWEKIGEFGSSFRISPDGRRYLYSTFHQSPNASKMVIWDIWLADAKGGTPVRIVEDAGSLGWSPDGKKVLYFKAKDSNDGVWHGPTWLLDLETKQAKQLPVPETDQVDDWSRDGKWLVTVSDRHPPHGRGYQLYVMHPDGTDERRLTEGALNCYPKFSPDGKRIVYHRSAGRGSLWVVDIDGSNRTQAMIENADGSEAPDHASWSPDGKWLVVKLFNWQIRTTDEGKKVRFRSAPDGKDHIAILAPDGTNRRDLQLKGVLKSNWIEDPEWY